MKTVLIISPQFPPLNAADMHRVRQGLPYFRKMGWEPVVITVDPEFAGAYSTDEHLLKTIPADVEVHRVKAFPEKHTRRFGLGSLGMRSAWHIYRMGCRLMRKRRFDLVYFSTTAFHVMALGPLWKRKFGVPFMLDIQDPWRNDFYLSKPASERPPKFFISYRIDKYLEAFTVPRADGIISVSKAYCDTFLQRYPVLKQEQCRVIPFGAAMADLELLHQVPRNPAGIRLNKNEINVVYAGRGGHDLRYALEVIFGALAEGLKTRPDLFSKMRCWFAGTSYAPPGKGKQTILPVARQFGVADHVSEITDRLPYVETLQLLEEADQLLVPGSTDTAYTASKIYPYIMLQKPLLAVFYKGSSVVDFLRDNGFGYVLAFDHEQQPSAAYSGAFLQEWIRVLEKGQPRPDMIRFHPYTAEARTREQVDFFEAVCARKIHTGSK